MEYRIMNNSFLLKSGLIKKKSYFWDLHSILNPLFYDSRYKNIQNSSENLLKQVTLGPVNLTGVVLDVMNHFVLKIFFSLSIFQHFYYDVLRYRSLCIYPSWACWGFKYVMFFIKHQKFSTTFPWYFFYFFLSLLSFLYSIAKAGLRLSSFFFIPFSLLLRL